MRHYVAEPPRVETRIKILRGATFFCQRSGCGREATHLFRSGTGPITAYCELHAEMEADRIGVDLPMDRDRLIHGLIRRLPQVEYDAPGRCRRGRSTR
jgi:hypothetical protein